MRRSKPRSSSRVSRPAALRQDRESPQARQREISPPCRAQCASGKLFGGQPSDEVQGRQSLDEIENVDEDDDHDVAVRPAREPEHSPLVAGALIVGQCVLAVALGAGLFIAFDQLWQWNNIVALVLSVLVILGLVVGVRVVRKTEDIGSTLIAVAVGAMVTLGPLVLLRSH